MPLDAKKYLYDNQRAAALLTEFTTGKEFDEYARDPMLRAAVERQFEVIGEALARLAKLDKTLAERVSEYERIIAFRNILIHGYAEVDDRLVWDIVQAKLRRLVRDVALLTPGD